MPTFCSPSTAPASASSKDSRSAGARAGAAPGRRSGSTRPCVGCHGGSVVKTDSCLGSAQELGTYGISTSRPRRRRNPSPQTIHVAVAASPRPVRGRLASSVGAPTPGSRAAADLHVSLEEAPHEHVHGRRPRVVVVACARVRVASRRRRRGERGSRFVGRVAALPSRRSPYDDAVAASGPESRCRRSAETPRRRRDRQKNSPDAAPRPSTAKMNLSPAYLPWSSSECLFEINVSP